MFWIVEKGGSLDYYTIVRQEQYCQQLHKWDEISYVKAFMEIA